MSDADLKGQRPLSPHLQIYKPMLTMMMSIVHRATGFALYFGTLLLAWWLIAAATGPEYFEMVNSLMGSIIGRTILLGYTWALIHHLLGGLRHLVWDTGRGLGEPARERFAQLTLAGSIVLTLVVWIIGYALR